MVATRMACAPEVMSRASAYTAALGQARTARMDGKRLTLLGEDGAVLATFEPQGRDLRYAVTRETLELFDESGQSLALLEPVRP
jgi:hypothetical protein